MIRFGAQGAYVIYFGVPREDSYSGQGAYFFFEKQPKIKKKDTLILHPPPQFKRDGHPPPHLKNCSAGPVETIILSRTVFKPTVWKRYIDDIFSRYGT